MLIVAEEVKPNVYIRLGSKMVFQRIHHVNENVPPSVRDKYGCFSYIRRVLILQQFAIRQGFHLRERFEKRVAEHSIGHMGIPESVELLGHALGLELDEVTESIEPVISAVAFEVGDISVAAGGVCGVKQIGIGSVAGKPKLTLRFVAALRHPDPRERIVITGEPSFEMVIPGGIHGDIATSAVLLNVLAPIMASQPGLHTMATIPATTWR